MTAAMSRAEAIAALTAAGSEYELETLELDGRTLRNFRTAPASLRAMYEKYLSDLPFLVYEDDRYTFAEAWRAASRIGHLLVHECGVGTGDRVAIAMRNYPEWILAFSAITSICAVAVALNAHWQPDEMAHALADCGAKVVFADQERLDRLVQGRPAPDLRVFAVRATRLPDGVHALSAAVAAAVDVAMPPVDIAPDDLATMLYTSGSSGRAKGVPSTHRNILAALMSWALDARITELVTGVVPVVPATQPGTLLAVPLFHVTGLHASYLASYGVQRRVVCMYRWDPELAARLVDRERLTSITAPAAITGDLVRVARAGGHDLSTLVYVGGGGAPRAPEQVRQIHASFAGAAPHIGWGMTETNAIGTNISGADYLARPASSGRCSQVLELCIVDAAGHQLPPGERGELWVRGTSVFRGYWKRTEATAAAFAGDWFRTGDGAYIDDEGFLFIVDRIKDLIIRGGENIGCGQVEAALLMHPEVREAAVYAVPDERMGEEVGATIYAGDALDLDQLREFLAGQLARYELPRYILRSSEPLPRTPSGKIFKRQIRDAAVAQLGTAITKATTATRRQAMKTRITELFGIRYPIIQGGMHYVGFAELAAAVSNAGGLGLITGLTQRTPELLAGEIRRCRAMTDKPFGVNLTFLPSLTPIDYPGYVRTIIDGGIKIVETAGNNPQKWLPALQDAGIKVIHKCTSVRHALKAQSIGCDAASIDGFECGGHPGEDDVPNFVLLPRAADELNIPFVASGGMADGRSLVAALALGAEGMNMGTRFIATQEAPVHDNVKRAIVAASELDTRLVMRPLRNTERVLKNAAVERLLETERSLGANLKFEDILGEVAGVYPRIMQDGEMDAGAWSCGMVAGLVHDVPTVKELIDRIMAQAHAIIDERLAKLSAR